MARQHRDDELRGVVHHQHAGVLVLALQVRGDQPHHRAQRDEEDDLVEAREQAGHLVLEGALVGAHRVELAGEGGGELGRHADLGRGQLPRQGGGLGGAVLGEGHQDRAGHRG
jgi:hypothetical protein